MSYILINAWPILAATIAGLVFSYAGLALFGGADATGPSIRLWVGAILAQGWLCIILAGAVILAPDRAGPWTMALGSAFIIWIGFVLPAVALTLGYGGAGAGTIAGACALWLGVMVLQAAVLQGIGVVPPPEG